MNAFNPALLVNLLGFAVGISLYSMLGMMVLRHRKTSGPANANFLLLTTAFLGFLWNVSELFVFVGEDFGFAGPYPLIAAAAYSALGFLPSVVVHSAQDEAPKPHWVTFGAYGLSTFAAVMHFATVLTGGNAPSELALQAQTLGSLTLAAILLIFNFRERLEKKAVWATALLIFAASAFHLSGDRESNSWVIELVAHQSSLPLALVILYQNYRFAFADLFLKRSISLILLTLVASALYVWVAAPLLKYHETHDRNDAQAIGLILTLWIGTALAYPSLHGLAVWLVDKIILQRIDYAAFQTAFAGKLETIDSPDAVLDTLRDDLAAVLTAGSAEWTERGRQEEIDDVPPRDDTAGFSIPTVEAPNFKLRLGEFHGGRRLLSEEIQMVEAVTLLSARRIDALRVMDERFHREFREQEFSKLAAEARLTALRAQINPHFLFNSRTTIGYLIETAPDKAFRTLLQLTKLLRGILSSTSEFSTLGDEMKLIESYLEIERARFEERLVVTIDVPKDLEKIRIPALILQPLVENAVKHGITENRTGGEVRIAAALEQDGKESFERLVVSDTGSGRAEHAPSTGAGVGLKNIRERLASYYGGKADFRITTDQVAGTRAEIRLPQAKMAKSQELRAIRK
jgi:hypothetical protein